MKKGYLGFVLWTIIFSVLEIGICIIDPGENITMFLVFNIAGIGVVILTLMIYLTQKVYWYSGIDYKTAVLAGPERRKQYAKKILIMFAIFEAVFLLLSVVVCILKLSMWIDFIVLIAGVLAISIMSVKIKL